MKRVKVIRLHTSLNKPCEPTLISFLRGGRIPLMHPKATMAPYNQVNKVDSQILQIPKVLGMGIL